MLNLMQFFEQIFNLWKGFSFQKKIAYILSCTIGIAVFSALLLWATDKRYVPLLTNLSPEDAAEIVENLQAHHVAYHLASNGTAILVPEEQVHDLRLSLAGDGLPKGGNIGFEIFDEPNFGMSQFSEHMNYRRALEGELRRTIKQIESIRDVRVHIVMRESGLFRDDEKDATASITLQMLPGRHLSRQQVQAIVHLVSSSVAGLLPGRVTVVDNAGNILAKGNDENGEASNTLDRQRALEKSLEDRVTQILIPIVGEGHIVARVTAQLDFSHIDKTSETYDPQSLSVRSEQSNKEVQQSAGAVAATGIPGSRTNLTGYKSATNNQTTSGANHEKTSETRNYEINKIVQHEIGHTGRLVRLSVAVLVDGVKAPGSDKIKERSQEELTRLTDLVKRAVGFDADRDDQVVVQSMLFDTPVTVAEKEDVAEPMWVLYAQKFWLPALVMVFALAFITFLFRNGKKMRESNVNLLDTPRRLRDLEAAMQHLIAAPPEDPKKLPVSKPEATQAANVLKGWLNQA